MASASCLLPSACLLAPCSPWKDCGNRHRRSNTITTSLGLPGTGAGSVLPHPDESRFANGRMVIGPASSGPPFSSLVAWMGEGAAIGCGREPRHIVRNYCEASGMISRREVPIHTRHMPLPCHAQPHAFHEPCTGSDTSSWKSKRPLPRRQTRVADGIGQDSVTDSDKVGHEAIRSSGLRGRSITPVVLPFPSDPCDST